MLLSLLEICIVRRLQVDSAASGAGLSLRGFLNSGTHFRATLVTAEAGSSLPNPRHKQETICLHPRTSDVRFPNLGAADTDPTAQRIGRIGRP
jgi:hypothetical protein